MAAKVADAEGRSEVLKGEVKEFGYNIKLMERDAMHQKQQLEVHLVLFGFAA